MLKIWLNKETELIIDSRIKDQRLFRLSELAMSLEKNDHRVSMFFSSFDHFKKQHRNSVNKPNSSIANHVIKTIGYKSHVSIQRALSHYIYATRLNKLIKKLDSPDVVVVSIPNIDSAFVLANYCKSKNIPYIVDVRDLWPDILNISSRGVKRIVLIPYYYFLEYKLVQILMGATSVVATSPNYIDWAKTKVPKKNFFQSEVIYLGAKYTLGNKVQTLNEKISIVFAGTINRQFDFDKVFIAAEKLLPHQDIEFIIIGDGDFYSYLVDKSKKLRNVRLTGWLNGVELSNTLSQGFLGLLPYEENVNFTGNVTNKFSEYLSYGLPQLVGVSGIMAELAEQHNVGLYYHDGNELANQIISLIQDQNRYNQMVENSRSLFEREFKFDVVNEKYQNVIINAYHSINK